jgi:hypothetical protein
MHDPRIALETLQRLHEFRRRASVQTQFVGDGDFALKHGLVHTWSM